MGYCPSYSEVPRFEDNTSSSVVPDVLGSQFPGYDAVFAADKSTTPWMERYDSWTLA